MPILGLEWTTAVILFGWIPFWWATAVISLYRMRKNDKRNGDRATATIGGDSGGGT